MQNDCPAARQMEIVRGYPSFTTLKEAAERIRDKDKKGNFYREEIGRAFYCAARLLADLFTDSIELTDELYGQLADELPTMDAFRPGARRSEVVVVAKMIERVGERADILVGGVTREMFIDLARRPEGVQDKILRRVVANETPEPLDRFTVKSFRRYCDDVEADATGKRPYESPPKPEDSDYPSQNVEDLFGLLQGAAGNLKSIARIQQSISVDDLCSREDEDGRANYLDRLGEYLQCFKVVQEGFIEKCKVKLGGGA
jgi:hypothetical protein